MLTVGDDELAWETTMTRRRRLPRNGTHAGEASIAASRLRVSGKAQALALLERRVLRNYIIANFYHYIRVLLKKTNLMIYNMLYKI